MNIKEKIEQSIMRRGLLSEDKIPIPVRTLGKTNRNVTIIGLGGQGSLETSGDVKNNVKIIQRAYELGITYFDTSPIYNKSEDYYGEAIQGFRNKIFLATKSDKRDRDGALKSLGESLRRLKTDYIDLWQIHHLDTIEEVDKISGKDGALEAFVEMKEQGIVKNIGITGHECPKILAEMSKRYNFDTVLCAVNAADRHVKPSFIDTLLPIAKKQNMGIIGMKVFAQGYMFNKDGVKTVWEPIYYTLSQDVDTIIVGCDDVYQLEENVAIVKSFRKLEESELKEIENKTKTYTKAAQFFRKKFGGYDSKDQLDKPLLMPS